MQSKPRFGVKMLRTPNLGVLGVSHSCDVSPVARARPGFGVPTDLVPYLGTQSKCEEMDCVADLG